MRVIVNVHNGYYLYTMGKMKLNVKRPIKSTRGIVRVKKWKKKKSADSYLEFLRKEITKKKVNFWKRIS